MRLYRYVGPTHLKPEGGRAPEGIEIHSVAALAAWLRSTKSQTDESLIATYVVDAERVPRLADRSIEHVVCAGGMPVRSAGEIAIEHIEEWLRVTSISNQSTGYCPEPESWREVEAALKRAGLEPPAGFDPACVFRRCAACQSINLVKEGYFDCDLCGRELPAAYNCQDESN